MTHTEVSLKIEVKCHLQFWIERVLFVLWVVRLEALCIVQQESLQNQQDKFKPEVENGGVFPLVLAKGNVQLCQKKKKKNLEKKQSSG